MTSKPKKTEAEKLMLWVQRALVEPFDEEEILGDHRIIVELYKYARKLEGIVKEMDQDRGTLMVLRNTLNTKIRTLESALRECEKAPGSSRRIVCQTLDT